jgi:anaerobic ribonucleoside-triphosphate reductase activating protein
MPVEQIVAFVKKIADIHPVDGITISGGDPLEQAEELCLLLELVHPMIHDILVYTGYTLDEAKEILPGTYSRIAQNIGALIDGRYVDELNDSKTPLMGSTNQALHFFDESLKVKYERYTAGGRQIQNVYFDEKLLSVGIHNREAQ